VSEAVPAMSAERWLRVQNVFSAALECENPAERNALVAQQCGDDADLRREVQSLLSSHDSAGMLDQFAAKIAAPERLRERVVAMDWQGRRIAQYTVLEGLGSGAMGLVHRARDERLGRHVALKFLPSHLAAHPEARQRFLLEARAAAALDHPNICTVHEIGSAPDGQPFIAMALYDGETLRARLERERLAIPEAVAIAVQIANGLAKAHEGGVVHRDVKPSNIMLLPDGMVKILDFGVARITAHALPGQESAVGTAAYMSPEQARGDPVDFRTDIWSLGVVLREMTEGARMPPALQGIVSRALAENPLERHPSMADMAAALVAAPLDEEGAISSEGERRHAAVLVSFVSEYDSLVERLNAVKLEELMRRVHAAATEIAQRHGGLVNYAFGEEIVCLFGVPTGHEDDELRAVRAAVELHARVRDIGTLFGNHFPVAFQLQSGVHSGPLIARRLHDGQRRYGVTGLAAQMAARLASVAGRDDVLLSPECQRRVAPFFDAVPGEPFVLKADHAPITPHRVIGESGLQTRLEAAEREGLTPYSGRRAELAALESYLEQARQNRGGVVFVAGEAGVGKSRLLHEFRARMKAAPVRVLQARCRSYGGGGPYSPFVELLKAALDIEGRGFTADEVVMRIRAVDVSLLPFTSLFLDLLSVTQQPQPVRGDHLKAEVPEALVSFLAAFGRKQPTVFLLEDWHWSDAGSKETLRRLSGALEAHPLLVVVTTRPPAAESANGERSLQIGPLDFDSALAIMKSLLHVPRVSPEVARQVYERTGGNPFFIEEVCHASMATGLDSFTLPDTVQAVIRTRLDTLDRESLEVLRVASVIGREFAHELLTTVLSQNIDADRAIERLNAAGLIQPLDSLSEPGYRFKHVLTQEVTYDSLLGHQRRALHQMIGSAIEQGPASRSDEQAALLAHHFALAESWASAIHYGRRAAARASALTQFADALATLDQVREWLGHMPESPEQLDIVADVLLQQERLCETLGQRGRQQEIVDELVSSLAPRGASERLAQAYARQGDLSTLLKRFDAADRSLSTALRLCRERGDVPMERNVLRSIGLLRWHEGRHSEALVIMESALAIDRQLGEELAVAGDLANLGVILRSMGEYPRAIAALEEAISMPALESDATMLVYGLQATANVYRELGDLDRVLTTLQRANEVSRVLLLPIQRSFNLMGLAHLYLQQNRIDESLQTYEEAIALSRRARHADGLVQSLRARGEVLFGICRYDEALPHFQEAATLFAQLDDRASEAEMWTRVATVLERGSDCAGAESAWEKVRVLRVKTGDAHGQLDALEGIARSVRKQGAPPEQAIARVEAALTLACTLGEERREAALRNTLGILNWESGRYFQALRQYEQALVLLRKLGDKVHEGLALNSLAVTLTRLSRHEEARTALEESIRLNRETGEQLLEAHALAALGDVHVAGQRFAAATECFEQSLQLRKALGDTNGEQAMRKRLSQVRG
jgi:tetratricopeptide (TPR) repeat protein/class 3 adenylate cyclase/MoxR-like ATPase